MFFKENQIYENKIFFLTGGLTAETRLLYKYLCLKKKKIEKNKNVLMYKKNKNLFFSLVF